MDTSKHIVIDARGRRTSTGRYVDRLMEHLQDLDSLNRYTILLEPSDTWKPKAKNFTTKACHYKRFSFNPFDQLTFAFFLHRLKPNLVHFSMSPQEPVFYFGTRITTTHDLTMLRFARPGKLPRILHVVRMIGYRFLFWHTHHVAKHIIVPSKFVADDLDTKYPFIQSKTTVTYEASEPPIHETAAPLKGVAKPFIMHVGSPFPHKNLERLISAFEILRATHPDLQLVLAGKKEYYFSQLQKLIDTSPAKSDIIIPGFVTDGELKWLYTNTEAYVLPALSEGFGLPGLEAMVYGCPLVSSDATCLPEIYGNAAHYFDPTSAQDIAQKVDEVISDKQLQKQLIQKGAKQLQKYSWERMAKQTLTIYQKFL